VTHYWRITQHVLVALHNLKYCKAVEIVESERKLWWFVTPDADVRSKILHERTPETKPRAKRKAKLPK